MKRLEQPLKNALRSEDDEHAIQRIWHGIDARSFEPAPQRRGRHAALAVAGLVAATAVVLVWSRREAGPLRLADGRALESVSAPAEGLALPLSDGSSIALAPGSRLEPLESTSTTFLAVLQSGRGTFDIRPGGPRRWQVECGLATVEVLGTRFTCAREAGRLEVVVDRGVVLVRGERVPDRAQRLGAGQKLTVLEAPSSPAPALPTTTAGAPGSGDEAAAERPARASAEPASDRWRELAKSGHHKEAFAALGSQGVRRASRSLGVAGLLTLADVARLSGHPRDAVAPLERILRDFSTDAQAPLAAFELGRLELDALGHPLPAVMAFERALALGVPASLREDVQARLVEAYESAGDRERARLAAEAYLHEHPTGRYRRTLEARLSRLSHRP